MYKYLLFCPLGKIVITNQTGNSYMRKIIVIFGFFISTQLFAAPEKPNKNPFDSSIPGQRGRGAPLSSTSRSSGGGAPPSSTSRSSRGDAPLSTTSPTGERVDSNDISTAINVGVIGEIESDNVVGLIGAELFELATICF